MSEDEKVTLDQYGRKKWNVEAYARDSKRPKKLATDASRAEIPGLSEKALSYTEQRANLLEQSLSAVGKLTVINPTHTGTFGNEKRFGFNCPVCNVSFRDSLALIDHLNSPQHVQRAQALTRKTDGAPGGGELEPEIHDGVRHATTEDVVSTLEALVKALLAQQASGDQGISLRQRIERRMAFEKKMLARRREKRQRAKKRVENADSADPVAQMMGFSGFGSSKR